MAKRFTVSGEVVENAGNVVFDILSDSDLSVLKRGSISAEALERLNGGPYTDAASVFQEYQDKIASRAGDHWNANPLNDYVILGLGDF